MLTLGWHQENPDKRRRLAFMRARYKTPPTCECGKLALWLWNPRTRDRTKGVPYCQAHLPEPAKRAMSRLQDDLFVVAPYFDEPELEPDRDPEKEEDTSA